MRALHLNRKPAVDLFFAQTWQGDEYSYRPRPELFTAIDQLPALKTHLAKSMKEIVAAGSVVAPLPEGVPLQPPKVITDDDKGKAKRKVDDKDKIPPFHQLLGALDASGLYFPGETIANVLLALQVKRFVILTGISGTGKTRIGQAIAARFPMTRKVILQPETDSRTTIIKVTEDASKRDPSASHGTASQAARAIGRSCSSRHQPPPDHPGRLTFFSGSVLL